MDMNELTNWPEYTRIFAGIYALVPPPIIVPLFLGVMAGRSRSDQTGAALVASLSFLIVMLVFVFFGTSVLGVFGISLPAFRLAGGFLLLLIALDMMRSNPLAEEAVKDEGKSGGSALVLGIVPLTIPVLAGPGAISAVVLFAADHDVSSHRVLVGVVICVVALTVLLTLLAAAALARFFTPSVALVFNKVMGLIIAAIAFEFIMDGIAGHFPSLGTIHGQWIAPLVPQVLTSFS